MTVILKQCLQKNAQAPERVAILNVRVRRAKLRVAIPWRDLARSTSFIVPSIGPFDDKSRLNIVYLFHHVLGLYRLLCLSENMAIITKEKRSTGVSKINEM